MNRKAMLGDPPPIRITAIDLNRIDGLLDDRNHAISRRVSAFLRGEIDRAEIVDSPDSPDAFVRIGSTVIFEDEVGRQYTRTLVFPHRTQHYPDGVSVVTPVGSALLGLATGQSISFKTPDDRVKTLTVLKICATP